MEENTYYYEMEEEDILKSRFDVIEFRKGSFRYGHDQFDSVVAEIYINGRNLRDLVGNHAPLTVWRLYKSLHEEYKEDPYQLVLGCVCGCEDCDPLSVCIDEGHFSITWFGFYEDYALYSDDGYKGLGPFVFQKNQYFEEVEKLRKWAQEE